MDYNLDRCLRLLALKTLPTISTTVCGDLVPPSSEEKKQILTWLSSQRKTRRQSSETTHRYETLQSWAILDRVRPNWVMDPKASVDVKALEAVMKERNLLSASNTTKDHRSPGVVRSPWVQEESQKPLAPSLEAKLQEQASMQSYNSHSVNRVDPPPASSQTVLAASAPSSFKSMSSYQALRKFGKGAAGSIFVNPSVKSYGVPVVGGASNPTLALAPACSIVNGRLVRSQGRMIYCHSFVKRPFKGHRIDMTSNVPPAVEGAMFIGGLAALSRAGSLQKQFSGPQAAHCRITPEVGVVQTLPDGLALDSTSVGGMSATSVASMVIGAPVRLNTAISCRVNFWGEIDEVDHVGDKANLCRDSDMVNRLIVAEANRADALNRQGLEVKGVHILEQLLAQSLHINTDPEELQVGELALDPGFFLGRAYGVGVTSAGRYLEATPVRIDCLIFPCEPCSNEVKVVGEVSKDTELACQQAVDFFKREFTKLGKAARFNPSHIGRDYGVVFHVVDSLGPHQEHCKAAIFLSMMSALTGWKPKKSLSVLANCASSGDLISMVLVLLDATALVRGGQSLSGLVVDQQTSTTFTQLAAIAREKLVCATTIWEAAKTCFEEAADCDFKAVAVEELLGDEPAGLSIEEEVAANRHSTRKNKANPPHRLGNPVISTGERIISGRYERVVDDSSWDAIEAKMLDQLGRADSEKIEFYHRLFRYCPKGSEGFLSSASDGGFLTATQCCRTVVAAFWGSNKVHATNMFQNGVQLHTGSITLDEAGTGAEYGPRPLFLALNSVCALPWAGSSYTLDQLDLDPALVGPSAASSSKGKKRKKSEGCHAKMEGLTAEHVRALKDGDYRISFVTVLALAWPASPIMTLSLSACTGGTLLFCRVLQNLGLLKPLWVIAVPHKVKTSNGLVYIGGGWPEDLSVMDATAAKYALEAQPMLFRKHLALSAIPFFRDFPLRIRDILPFRIMGDDNKELEG